MTQRSAEQAMAAGSASTQHDWQTSVLGPLTAWPHCLRLSVDIVLNAPGPMLLAWGEQPVVVFNEAYAGLAGVRAPGGDVPATLPAPLAACALALDRARQGEPVRVTAQPLGFPGPAGEAKLAYDVHMTPVRDEHNQVAGVLCALGPCLASAAEPDAAPHALHVLVVEDNLDSQYLVCEMLKAFGHDAQGVADGEAALDLLRASHYDVLFSDVSLPGISGIELARQALGLQDGLRVVFASGFGEGLLQQLDFPYLSLQKPYEMEQLQGALDTIVQQQQR